ncbi:hypothetical protein DY000_02042710 [Brassica cretica]|uniref:Uncharacterized protein n=1 Tax=Brassica cretica TaxID=69181 RepID=A0ABQ7BCD3_BRACR|nr:hypothetical protein DY000_02042710 [Brassica cretica]
MLKSRSKRLVSAAHSKFLLPEPATKQQRTVETAGNRRTVRGTAEATPTGGQAKIPSGTLRGFALPPCLSHVRSSPCHVCLRSLSRSRFDHDLVRPSHPVKSTPDDAFSRRQRAGEVLVDGSGGLTAQLPEH